MSEIPVRTVSATAARSSQLRIVSISANARSRSNCSSVTAAPSKGWKVVEKTLARACRATLGPEFPGAFRSRAKASNTARIRARLRLPVARRVRSSNPRAVTTFSSRARSSALKVARMFSCIRAIWISRLELTSLRCGLAKATSASEVSCEPRAL